MKNFQIITNTLFAVACTLLLGGKSFAEPMNLSQLKIELRTYQTSGEYDKDFAAVIAQAQAYITSRALANKQAKPPEKLAIVLDIDETSLSNYPNIEARDFCTNRDQFEKDIGRANDPVLLPTLTLYRDALKQGVAVFFVTGRSDQLRKPTEKNLKAAGYEGWAGLFYRPKTDTQASSSAFKTQARMSIAHAGYTIIASIGDQQSDLTGGNAEKTFKLPNPYYLLQ